MKTDIFILIVPAFFILLTVIVKIKTSLPKAFYISLLCISIYLALGIYIPAMIWLVDKRTHLKQITFTDDQGKPISGVGVTLGSSYAIGSFDFSYVEYRIEAGISDAQGNLFIHGHVKPLPIILFPFILRFYTGTGYFVYKNGYYPTLASVESDRPTIKVVLQKATDNKRLFKLLDEYHYLHFKNIEAFADKKSAEIYAAVYRNLTETALLLHSYDNDSVVADSYRREYELISNALRKGEER